jgi:cell division protein FtsB
MATVQQSSVEELNRQSARLEAETRKLVAEANKLSAENAKLLAERFKLEMDTRISPWLFAVQAALAAAALMGAGAAFAKLFLS